MYTWICAYIHKLYYKLELAVQYIKNAIPIQRRKKFNIINKEKVNDNDPNKRQFPHLLDICPNSNSSILAWILENYVCNATRSLEHTTKTKRIEIGVWLTKDKKNLKCVGQSHQRAVPSLYHNVSSEHYPPPVLHSPSDEDRGGIEG